MLKKILLVLVISLNLSANTMAPIISYLLSDTTIDTPVTDTPPTVEVIQESSAQELEVPPTPPEI